MNSITLGFYRCQVTGLMSQDVEVLVGLVQATADFLLSVGEKHWGLWLKEDAHLLMRRDLRGLEHLLSADGGMGSINDLIIHPINGHQIDDSQVVACNERLHDSLGKMSTLARKLYSQELAARRS